MAILATTVLLIVLTCVFITMHAPNRYEPLMKGANAVESVAKRFQIRWLERLAWEKRRQFFEDSLALQVRRGDLTVVRVPAQRELDSKTFFPDLRTFSRSNGLFVAFMQAQNTSTGTTFAIYVRASDEGAIRDYVEHRTALR